MAEVGRFPPADVMLLEADLALDALASFTYYFFALLLVLVL